MTHHRVPTLFPRKRVVAGFGRQYHIAFVAGTNVAAVLGHRRHFARGARDGDGAVTLECAHTNGMVYCLTGGVADYGTFCQWRGNCFWQPSP